MEGVGGVCVEILERARREFKHVLRGKMNKNREMQEG